MMSIYSIYIDKGKLRPSNWQNHQKKNDMEKDSVIIRNVLSGKFPAIIMRDYQKTVISVKDKQKIELKKGSLSFWIVARNAKLRITSLEKSTYFIVPAILLLLGSIASFYMAIQSMDLYSIIPVFILGNWSLLLFIHKINRRKMAIDNCQKIIQSFQS